MKNGSSDSVNPTKGTVYPNEPESKIKSNQIQST